MSDDTHAKDGRLSEWPLAKAMEIAETYIEEYEFDDGETGYHVPTDVERMLMLDMVAGLFSEADFTAALTAALRAQPSDPVADWVMVPRVMTTEMLCTAPARFSSYEMIQIFWTAAIAAAPSPPPSVPARVEITEEMLERAEAAWRASVAPTAKLMLRAALEAALAGRLRGEEDDGQLSGTGRSYEDMLP